MTQQDLNGKTALVTGAAKGIGRACCLRLAAAGANIAINYMTSEAAAQETLGMVEQLGVQALAVQADVSSPEQVAVMVDTITASLGPLDLLVNNAGIFDYLDHKATTYAQWQRTMDYNLNSAYLVTWAVKESMAERKFGRIVNIASTAGLRARPNSIAYAVSKAGMIALTKSLAEAIAADNIRVNAIAPGLIETDIIRDVDEAAKQKLIDATPMLRMGQPSEIADVTHFLLSEQSSFMTGQTIVASGGRVLLP
ncbi:MAG: SDR family NAD(P)-dependent oxidoreductase [Pirellulaceae bacterium]